MSEILGELDTPAMDLLRLGFDGLDVATLDAIRWADLAPAVVECRFGAAGEAPEGGSWQAIGAFLRDRGYAVYVSEWHAPSNGERPAWRRVSPYRDDLDVAEAGHGKVLAFRSDPGWPAVRRAFDRRIVREGVTSTAQARSAVLETGVAQAAPLPALVPQPRPHVDRAADRPRRKASGVGKWVKRRSPTLHRMFRLFRRAGRGLWRRRRYTLPLAVVLGTWILLGFTPAMAPIHWLVWGSGLLVTAGLATVYAAYRFSAAMLRTRRQVQELRKSEKLHRKRLSEAKAQIRRLQQAVADGATTNADLLRTVGRLEGTITEATPTAEDGGSEPSS